MVSANGTVTDPAGFLRRMRLVGRSLQESLEEPQTFDPSELPAPSPLASLLISKGIITADELMEALVSQMESEGHV